MFTPARVAGRAEITRVIVALSAHTSPAVRDGGPHDQVIPRLNVATSSSRFTRTTGRIQAGHPLASGTKENTDGKH